MMRSSLYILSGTLVVAVSALWTSHSLAQSKETRPLGAIYAHGALQLSIPYQAPRTGEGSLLIEILDPEDGVVASVHGHADANTGQGIWTRQLALPQTLPFQDLVWHRLRYKFIYQGGKSEPLQGIASISSILRLPTVHVVGQQSYLSGSIAAIRLIVTESDNETPVTTGTVQIELVAPEKKNRILYTGALNERGTTPVQFRLPSGLVGRHSLRYELDTALGPVERTEEILIESKSSILLTTEKPIYQPGQTIHVRTLALDRSNHQATAGRKLTIELEDPKGNKVFRKSTQTDEYGLASAEFSLADEVNLGTYHLRALLENQGQTEVALRVERYVLPRFKVAVDLTGKDTASKRGFRPGDHVTGFVRANYFFGKPVAGEVTIKALGLDVTQFDAGASQGKTDSDGAFRFDIQLPPFFAGHPMNQGAARVLIEATVKDTAGHSETRAEPVNVSESALLLTVVPEGGTFIPGLENRVYVLAAYPDGTPAEAEIRVEASGNSTQTANTDSGGVALLSLAGMPASVRVKAKDREGNHATATVPLQARTGPGQILLRTEHAVYRAGESIRLQVFSTKTTGTAYLDVVKNRQTIGTYDVNIVNGKAELELTATPDMTGTVEFHAYLFGRGASPISDHRMIFVQPADELRIQTTLDSSVYKPGAEARIGFHVTNSRGEGVQAALGLEMIDQAVFALAEKQPGFAKVFFYLEQEALKPRYEIHSTSLPEAISSAEPSQSGQRDRAAQALFAAAQPAALDIPQSQFGRTVPQEKYSQYAARYLARLREQIGQAAGAELANTGKKCDQLVLKADLQDSELRDAWGKRLRVEPWAGRRFTVRSAGPDGLFNTADDLVLNREDPYCIEPVISALGGRIEMKLEPGNGVGNRKAEITGTVLDMSGAVIPLAAVQLMETATGRSHAVNSGPDGRFSVADFPAGGFQLRVTAPGFRTAVKMCAAAEGDHAVFVVVLDVGSVSESIEVTAEAAVLSTDSATVSTRSAPRMMALRKERAVTSSLPVPVEETHVRSWFPESLYVAPKIVTDARGRASITVPIADNITTWRMSMLASTRQGALGSGTSSLKVFQDFFTELDLPLTLTQGDQVSLPVAIYNYSGSRGQVRLRLAKDDWFSMVDDVHEKSLAIENDRVEGAQFTLEAKRIGKFKLTLKAEMDGPAKRADIVIREIEVIPNGREQNVAFNGRLEGAVEHTVTFPPNAIADAGKIFVRLYPGPLSQVVEGMDAILRMPYGCFEQTSSATYPNVLALDYMKRTKKGTPEIHAKAEGFIANGYQRLLTFEVPGGGFSWFGQAPANKILTSYGLMEFADMSKVHEIDPRVIERTQRWLARQQQADGSWKPDTNFINEGATGRYNNDVLRITAYIAWALVNTGYQGLEIERAHQFISANGGGRPDSYTLAVLANFAADYKRDRELTRRIIQQLVDAHTEKDDQAWWTADETAVYGRGASAAIETTGLVLQALLKSNELPGVTRKALNYISARKDSSGTWGTTQATIMALRALLLSMEKGSAEARGTVEITLNGKPVERLTLTPENNDLFHQFVLKGAALAASNHVAIRFSGEGSPAYQVTGQYFVPWTADAVGDPLSIAVKYNRTRLTQGDVASAVATVKNHTPATVKMLMIDLGIPPGFELLAEDLEDYRSQSAARKTGRLEKFNLTATQAILYFDSIGAGETITLRYRLRAKYPIRARTFQSRAYEYYNPEVKSLASPVALEIRKR